MSGILPETMNTSRVRAITKEAENYVLIKDNLYKRGKDGQLQMCATEEEYIPILQQAHSEQAGGHFSVKKMGKSILYAEIWWPTLFMDAEEFVKRCDECQRTKTPRGRDDMPLRPMMGARAFAKWEIDFVGPIAPPAYKSHAQYIIVATDYLTKWVEAKATTKNDAKKTAQFLYENIFTRYGLSIEIVSDRGTHFINEVIEQLLDEFMVIHRKSAPYHPQANGQAESTNKILVTILTKIVNESRADWDQKLHSALWAYRVAYKTSIGTTPFNMVYGIQAISPLEFLIPTLRVAKELEWTGHELSEQLEILEKLDETRLRAVASIYAQKRNMKSFFDQHVINKEFATGDYVLMNFGISSSHMLLGYHTSERKGNNAPYEVDELSTNEKSHIPDEVLAQIPAHIFIAKFRDEEGDNIKTAIMPREIWTLHRRPEVASAVRAVHLEQFFRLPPWGTDYMRAHELMSSIQYDGKAMLTDSDGAKVEVLITKKIINEALQFLPGAYDLIPKTKAIDNEKAFLKHLRIQKPPRYTEPFLHMAVVMALCVAERRQVRCDFAKFILESLIEANLKNSAKNKLYMNAGPMLTRVAYQALGMIEDLPAASSQASLIQQPKYVPKAVRTTSSTAFRRSTRSKKSSSDEERTDTDKEQDS
ncbi:hypothetical protein L7F22_013793 [Adiantum nelumboides]|nr:hypothetical protein [Adiantum nelumboides]